MKPTILPAQLHAAQERAYRYHGWTCNACVIEPEQTAYSGCSFEMNGNLIHFRVANITPKKSGAFVSFWKRNNAANSIPYDNNDLFDLLVVSIRNGTQWGQFVFPKQILYQKGCLSDHGAGGKRGMRIYAPWDITDNRQAQATQAWQCAYFVHLEPAVDQMKLHALFT